MKRQQLITGSLVVAIILVTLGILFLCAAMQNSQRFWLAGVLLAAGAGLAIWSGRELRMLQTLKPEELGKRITALAAAGDAEVTLAQVVAGLHVSDEAALSALQYLSEQGVCHFERREEREVYVFPGLREGRVVRRCPYCGHEFGVRDAIHQCPNCGGTITIERT
ncbi:MAG: hypothetical protein JXA21_14885 [Anaerolineae bacterium]|nr:hypothetical protein [Anaerolineae bacterium]